MDDECNNPSSSLEMEMEMEMVVAEDLILEILIRLPPISVFKFKFVSKSWYSLISNLDFLRKHHHHHHHRHSDDILLLNTEESHSTECVLLPTQTTTQNQEQEQELKGFLDYAFSVFIPQKINIYSSRLVDSCNGLLLYCNTISDGDEIQWHVLNPITKQCFELPTIEHFGNNFKEICINWMHIVFDPSVSLSFKILMCYNRREMDGFGIYVYSSETSSWKYLIRIQELGELCNWIHIFVCHWRAVLLDGMLWLYSMKDKLVIFDVLKDDIWLLPLPPRAVDHHKRNFLYFGECGGRLRLIERYSSYDHQIVTSPYGFYIMELEDMSDVHDHQKIRNWTVKYRVNIEMSYYEDRIIHIYKTGGAAGKKKKNNKGEEDEDEALLFLDVGRNMVISYNLTTNTFGKERNISNSDHSGGLHVFPFTPTLFTLS